MIKPKANIDMRIVLTLIFVATISLSAFAQVGQETEIKNQPQDQAFTYAYISVEGKTFSKKLIVVVDFGDTPEQIKNGKEYSELLTNKKSYAAILNHMVENGFDLVDTLVLENELTVNGSGGGGTSGIIFIMKKKK